MKQVAMREGGTVSQPVDLLKVAERDRPPLRLKRPQRCSPRWTGESHDSMIVRSGP